MCDTKWTNEQIVKEVFRFILGEIYSEAERQVRQKANRPGVILNLAKSSGRNIYHDQMVTVQSRSILLICAYLNRAIGPGEWPGIDLLNAETRDSVSTDFSMDFAGAEFKYGKEED